MKRDPVERTIPYRRVCEEAERLAWAALAEEGLRREMFGICHRFWATKQRILRERFGIQWQSPSDMNPDIIFD